MNIQEALTREVGETIVKISGLVTRAGKRTESDHPEYGHTSFQPITIKDSTGEIGVTLGGQLEIKQGVSITIEAHKSDKHGFTGIKVESYKNLKQLKVSKSAIITVEGTDMSKKPETPLKSQVNAIPVAPGDVKPDWDAKDRRIARLSAWKSSIEYFRGNNAPPEEMKDLAHYIEADVYRAGITPEQEEQIKIDSDDTQIPF